MGSRTSPFTHWEGRPSPTKNQRVRTVPTVFPFSASSPCSSLSGFLLFGGFGPLPFSFASIHPSLRVGTTHRRRKEGGRTCYQYVWMGGDTCYPIPIPMISFHPSSSCWTRSNDNKRITLLIYLSLLSILFHSIQTYYFSYVFDRVF